MEDLDEDAVTVTERIPVPSSSSIIAYKVLCEFTARPGVEYGLDMSGGAVRRAAGGMGAAIHPR